MFGQRKAAHSTAVAPTVPEVREQIAEIRATEKREKIRNSAELEKLVGDAVRAKKALDVPRVLKLGSPEELEELLNLHGERVAQSRELDELEARRRACKEATEAALKLVSEEKERVKKFEGTVREAWAKRDGLAVKLGRAEEAQRRLPEIDGLLERFRGTGEFAPPPAPPAWETRHLGIAEPSADMRQPKTAEAALNQS